MFVSTKHTNFRIYELCLCLKNVSYRADRLIYPSPTPSKMYRVVFNTVHFGRGFVAVGCCPLQYTKHIYFKYETKGTPKISTRSASEYTVTSVAI
jgi:hypothetical protein